MATRFYLPSTGSPAVSPSFEPSWQKTSDADRIKAVWTKISSGFATKTCTENSAIDNYEVLNRQYVIGPINAVDLRNTTHKMYIRCMEDNGAANFLSRVYLQPCDSSGNPRAEEDTDFGSTEFDNKTLENREMCALGSIPNHSDWNMSDGEYMAVEIGILAGNTKTDVYTATMDFGDNSGTDLPEDESEQSQYNPWIEFSADITEYVPSPLSINVSECEPGWDKRISTNP